MSQQIISKEKRRSLIFFLICGMGILIFVFAAMYPRYNVLMQIKKQTDDLKVQIDRQKELLPLLALRFQELERLRLPDEISSPNKAALLPEEREKISSDIEQLAAQSRLGTEAISFGSDFETVSVSLVTLTQEVEDKDSLSNIRHFLIGLENLSYTDRIERIAIRAVEQSKRIEIRYKLVKKK